MKTTFIILLLSLFTLALQAQERKITTSDGVELYVNVKGKGTPCLYLHGGPGSGSYWFETFFGEFMESNFTMIYLDQRGVGRSGSPANGDYSLQRMTLDFEEIRKELGYENWLTLGHSFGGVLQMGYIEAFPEAQQGMMMINCTLDINESFNESWAPKASEFLGVTHDPQGSKDLSIIEQVGSFASQLRHKQLFWKMAYADPKNEAIMDETYQQIQNWNGDFGNIGLDIPDYLQNFKPKTAQVKQPVLFFYGTEDWMVGPDHYKGINFPEMMLWESKVGHVPFLENKADLQNSILAFKAKYTL